MDIYTPYGIICVYKGVTVHMRGCEGIYGQVGDPVT